MKFASLGTIRVLEPASGALVELDLDALLDELRQAFLRCSIQEEWMADSLLEVLGERLREDGEEGVFVTSQEVRARLVGILEASGLSEVAREFVSCAAGAPEISTEFPTELRVWTPSSLGRFLRNRPEIPGEYLPEVLHRLPSMLSGTGFAEASETLVLEISRHLVHFLKGEVLSSSTVAMTSPTRYITGDAWKLPVEASGRELLERRVVVLQPVSDVLPVAVIQCHLLRLFDMMSGGAVDEASLLARLEGVSSFLQQCLVLMRGRMSAEWPDVQFGGAVVRMMGFSGILRTLTSARHRKERRELGLRLEEAIRGRFADAPFSLVVRFS